MWICFVINSSLAIGIGDPVASVGRLALSFTDRRNSSQDRQTPPVGRSEKARRHSPELLLPERSLSFQTYKARRFYLDVWVTWCGPRCEEIPYMEKVAEYFGNDPRIEIVSISVDANCKAWETKLEKYKPEWKQFLQKNFCD